MSDATTIGSRGPALVLVIAGLLTLLGSFLTWGSCPTTPCGGPFQALSFYSGFDLGFGFVTAIAGLLWPASASARFATWATLALQRRPRSLRS